MRNLSKSVVLALCIGLFAACQQAQVVKKEAIGDRLPDFPFSEVVKVGNTYYFSGKVGTDPATQKLAEGGIEAETKAVMEAFGAQLEKLGMGFDDLVMSTVYLSDINDYQGMNAVYKSYFTAAPPARATVAVKDLVLGAKIEIAFIAVKTD